MTSIEQLQVCGIRSFNPNPASRQVVTFYKPLTVILGKNGAGKTTIIEALLNACTGAMPPGSGTEKSAFVYDPKVLGEHEVKAQIRLIFTGKGGKMMQVIRSFQAARLRNKVSFTTLDNTIAFQDPNTGVVVSNTYRASDVDRVVPEMLGVSAAVLEHVIFCHQEDCNWPLAPPKDVKRIFDDIFAATRYVLALERLRENSKEFKRQQKEHETSLMALREHREQSKQLEHDLARKEEAVRAIQVVNAAVEPELQILRTAAQALDSAEREVDELTREATLLQGRMEEKRAALQRGGVQPSSHSVSELHEERDKLAVQQQMCASDLAEHTSQLQRNEVRLREAEKAMYDAQTAEQLLRQSVNQHEQRVQQLCALLKELLPDGEDADVAVLRSTLTRNSKSTCSHASSTSRGENGKEEMMRAQNDDGNDDGTDVEDEGSAVDGEAALQRAMQRVCANVQSEREAVEQAEAMRQAQRTTAAEQRAAVQRSSDADDAEYDVVTSLAIAAEVRVNQLRSELPRATGLAKFDSHGADEDNMDDLEESVVLQKKQQHLTRQRARVETLERQLGAREQRHRRHRLRSYRNDDTDTNINNTSNDAVAGQGTVATEDDTNEDEDYPCRRRRRRDESALLAEVSEQNSRVAQLRRTLARLSATCHRDAEITVLRQRSEEQRGQMTRAMTQEVMPRLVKLSISLPSHPPWASATDHTVFTSNANNTNSDNKATNCSNLDGSHYSCYSNSTKSDSMHDSGAHVRWLQLLCRRVAEARDQCETEESRAQAECQSLGKEVAQLEQRHSQLRKEWAEHAIAVQTLRSRAAATLQRRPCHEGECVDSAAILTAEQGDSRQPHLVAGEAICAGNDEGKDKERHTMDTHSGARERTHACIASHKPSKIPDQKKDGNGYSNMDANSDSNDAVGEVEDLLECYEVMLQQAREAVAHIAREQHLREATAACYASFVHDAQGQHRCPLCDRTLDRADEMHAFVARAAQQQAHLPMQIREGQHRARAAAARLSALESVQPTVAEWRWRVALMPQSVSQCAEVELALSMRRAELMTRTSAMAAVHSRMQELVELRTHLTRVYAMAEEMDELAGRMARAMPSHDEVNEPNRLLPLNDNINDTSSSNDQYISNDKENDKDVTMMTWQEASEAYEAATATLEQLHAALVAAQRERCEHVSHDEGSRENSESENDSGQDDGEECEGVYEDVVGPNGVVRRTRIPLRRRLQRAREALYQMELRLSQWTERQSALTRAVSELTELRQRQDAVQQRRAGHHSMLQRMDEEAAQGMADIHCNTDCTLDSSHSAHRLTALTRQGAATANTALLTMTAAAAAAHVRQRELRMQELAMVARSVQLGWQQGHVSQWRQALQCTRAAQHAHRDAVEAVGQNTRCVSAAQDALLHGQQQAAQLERALVATELQATLQKDAERFAQVEEALGEIRSSRLGAEAESLLGPDARTQSMPRLRESIRMKLAELEKARAQREGHVEAMLNDMADLRGQLEKDKYQNIEKRYRAVFLKVQTTEIAVKDVDRYYNALEKAVQSYHQAKITQINQIIAELWRQTYRGSDIDTVEICSESESLSATTMLANAAGGTAAARRSYNYRVVMRRGGSVIDMRGRCSAGQRVLASVIIRLALSEAFCCDCGILALDEPTTNLDEENARSLAEALRQLIETRRAIKHFQLIVITHDEQFVRALGGQSLDNFYYIHKDRDGAFSVIEERTFDQLFV